ncbi:MAG: ATP-binding cassette domain-containing protein [Nitrososphaerota archaeon]|nr:ATP-binding cassette domain-containing protein [Nitrososphaerota archaeon]MDG6941225.1 ATP-binding cassette domain-containing protein [Nitrososphaerota archaeon]MDG6970746.1 ATP-binding cassette domain-containing protein [Nitrososphaerota archaeon]MDG6980169.1 ATP-binding cassette domain-containing protein [Nitrososphaerota archaeon]MDG7004372.1 ATP-binding cassette domain-containing protein [Nitrososphaerota archaeon]
MKARLGEFHLSADIRCSGTTCLAGKNGSGKTSLLNALAGLIPSEGTVRVDGKDISRLPVEQKGIVMVTPSSCIPHLDVEAHLRWGAKLKGKVPPQEEIAKVKSELGIDFMGPVRSLSLGMRGRVSLATAFFSAPKVILVDEVFSLLHDKDGFVTSYRTLASGAGIDLIFTSQNEEDGRLAEQTYVMHDGTATYRS